MIPAMTLRPLLVLSIAALLTGACLAQGEQKPWHEPTGVSTMPSPDLPFDEYVRWATGQLREALRKRRPDLSPAEQERLVAMRAPFEWPPDPPAWGPNPTPCPAPPRDGILLSHGLTDSPFLMRDVGRHFREKKCFLVRAILLPGHGTVPGDLLGVSHEDWIKAARYGIDSFPRGIANLYVAGFSTGGTLAVYHALDESKEARERITGLILLSPAIAVADAKAPLANWHKIYSWALPRGEWVDRLFDERDAVKYESFPKNAGDQIHLLTRAVADRRKSRPLETPVFVALSRDDSTVSSPATIEFFNAVTPAPPPWKNALINYTRVPYALGDQQPIHDRSSVYPSDGIVSFSHVAIPVRPDNEHYGRHGDKTYKSCLAYETANNEKPDDERSKLLARCRTGRPPGDGVRLGETSLRKDLKEASELERLVPRLVLRRLTFNPDFEGMMAEIDAFVTRVQTGAR